MGCADNPVNQFSQGVYRAEQKVHRETESRGAKGFAGNNFFWKTFLPKDIAGQSAVENG